MALSQCPIAIRHKWIARTESDRFLQVRNSCFRFAQPGQRDRKQAEGNDGISIERDGHLQLDLRFGEAVLVSEY